MDTSWKLADIVNISVAVAALLVACCALFVALQAWRRPFPPDPTKIPTFGRPDRPEIIDNEKSGLRLIEFINEHAGRKVRLLAAVGPDFYFEPDDDYSSPRIRIPDRSLMDPAIRNKPLAEIGPADGCMFHELQLESPSDRQHPYWSHGLWTTRGYFADVGMTGLWQGVYVYRISRLTDVEAVS